MRLSIPNSGEIELKTLILDLNGTITIRGEIVKGVSEKLAKLKDKWVRVVLLSGDTRGNAKFIAESLGVELVRASTGEAKRTAALNLNPETCVAIGNGLIDVALFEIVKLSIVTLQAEGAHTACLKVAVIIAPSILDALDLLIDESSLIATLRP